MEGESVLYRVVEKAGAFTLEHSNVMWNGVASVGRDVREVMVSLRS